MDSKSISRTTEIEKKEKETAGQPKPPSKKLRDRLRLLSFRRKKKELPKQENEATCSKEKPIPTLYENIEYSMRLSRLEEPKILMLALRHFVRKAHPNGKNVAFPVPEAFDRIQLKCANLPTDVGELKELLLKVHYRRNEVLDIEDLYSDFVKTHGRITYDFTQKWPQSHIFTRHP